MNDLLAGFLGSLRLTLPFQQLPATTRPAIAVWRAKDAALELLRKPVYGHVAKRRGVPTTVPVSGKEYETAIQAGLAVLCSFARVVGTRQAIVSINADTPRAISFQPRPFGINWTAAEAITPDELRHDQSDPLLLDDPVPTGVHSVISTRGVVHLASRVALAIAHAAGDDKASGTATFRFANDCPTPFGVAVWRPLDGPRRDVRLKVR